jgi:hypothetical protein
MYWRPATPRIFHFSICAPGSVLPGIWIHHVRCSTTGLASPIEIVWLLYNSSHVFGLEDFMQRVRLEVRYKESGPFYNLLHSYLVFILRILWELWGSLPPYLIYARRRVDWGNTCMPLLCIIQYTTPAKQNRLFARLRKKYSSQWTTFRICRNPFLLSSRNLYVCPKNGSYNFSMVYYFKLRRAPELSKTC